MIFFLSGTGKIFSEIIKNIEKEQFFSVKSEKLYVFEKTKTSKFLIFIEKKLAPSF